MGGCVCVCVWVCGGVCGCMWMCVCGGDVRYGHNGGREREWMICDHSALYSTLHFNCSLHIVDLSCQDPPLRSHIPVFTIV